MPTVISQQQELTLDDVAGYVRAHIARWIAEVDIALPPAAYETELRERMIRVEEELRHQRDLMKQGFDLMDKRFEAMLEESNRRFDAVDKRFDAMLEESNRRFDVVDKRFDAVDNRFELMLEESNRRFETVDKRFEAMDKRFDGMSAESNRRFDEINRRMERFMYWSFSITVASASLVIAVLKFS